MFENSLLESGSAEYSKLYPKTGSSVGETTIPPSTRSRSPRAVSEAYRRDAAAGAGVMRFACMLSIKRQVSMWEVGVRGGG